MLKNQEQKFDLLMFNVLQSTVPWWLYNNNKSEKKLRTKLFFDVASSSIIVE